MEAPKALHHTTLQKLEDVAIRERRLHVPKMQVQERDAKDNAGEETANCPLESTGFAKLDMRRLRGQKRLQEDNACMCRRTRDPGAALPSLQLPFCGARRCLAFDSK